MTRQEHIERLKAIRNYCCAKKDIDSLDYAIASLETDEAYQLEYENRSGKWEQINKNEVNVIPQWKCSECGAEFECFDIDFEYCPNCGAKMVEEQTGEEV